MLLWLIEIVSKIFPKPWNYRFLLTLTLWGLVAGCCYVGPVSMGLALETVDSDQKIITFEFIISSEQPQQRLVRCCFYLTGLTYIVSGQKNIPSTFIQRWFKIQFKFKICERFIRLYRTYKGTKIWPAYSIQKP